MNEKIKIYSLNISAVLLLSFVSAHSVASVIGYITAPEIAKPVMESEHFYGNARPGGIINWDGILNSGFFRIGIPQETGEIQEEVQVDSSNISDLKLIGTITGSREYSRAMIRNKNNNAAEIFRVNQNVYGYRLSKISDYYVTLKSNGQTYRIEMYGDEEENANKSLNSVAQNPGGGGRRISRTISRATIQQKIQGNMDNMLKGLRIGPFREGNQITGYRLISVDPSNVLFDIGARSGDIIRRINNHPASSTEKIFELWKSFNTETKFIIDIERNNSIYTYDINITD